MENENYLGLAVAVTIIVVILFFGGWYVFIGQSLSGPTSPPPLPPEISQDAPLVYGTSTASTSPTQAEDIETLPVEEAD